MPINGTRGDLSAYVRCHGDATDDRTVGKRTGRPERRGLHVRILLQGRSARSIAVNPGGDQVQLKATAHVLRTMMGVDAQTSGEMDPDLSGFDAVHLFGLIRPQEAWVQARNAHRQGRPVFLSTVYCDVWEFERVARWVRSGGSHDTPTVTSLRL